MRKFVLVTVLGLFIAPWSQAEGVAEAKAAFAQGHFDRLHRIAQAMQGEALGDFAQYWWLLSQMTSLSAAEVDAALAAEHDPYLAERLRSAWLRELLRRQDYAAVALQFPLLQAPSAESQCAYAQAEEKLDAPGWQQAARARWLQDSPLPGLCWPLYRDMAAAHQLDEDALFQRLRGSLARRDEPGSQWIVQLLGRSWSAAQMHQLQTHPRQFIEQADLQNRLQRELLLHAIDLLAHSDRVAARQALQDRLPALPPGARAYAWERIGLQAAWHHEEEALQDFARAGTLSPEARAWEVRMALRQGDWPRALQAIGHMTDTQAHERAWLYWRGRALLALHKVSAGRRLLAGLSDDDDYYGLLARDQLGPLLRRPFDAEPSAADMRWAEHEAGLQRALALREAGLRYEAVQEWDWTLRTASDTQLIAAAELAFRQAWYDRAIYAAEHTHELRSLRLRYLMPYREVLAAYADELHLDPAWIYGLIRQESRFTQVARSGVGAQGLMQIMPATAQWVAHHLGLRYHAQAMNEIGTNVQLGTYYLKHILDELDGNPVLATAAYNAGPRRAREWQATQPMEAAIYVESIPFAETRDYVKKVMTNAEHYTLAFNAEHRMALHLQDIPARPVAISLQGP